jgi:hypothetical protein
LTVLGRGRVLLVEPGVEGLIAGGVGVSMLVG